MKRRFTFAPISPSLPDRPDSPGSPCKKIKKFFSVRCSIFVVLSLYLSRFNPISWMIYTHCFYNKLFKTKETLVRDRM